MLPDPSSGPVASPLEPQIDAHISQMPSDSSPPTADPALLHLLFERAARRWPERLALDLPPSRTHAERREYTYAELLALSGVLAAPLQGLVTGEGVVAILLPRTCGSG